MCTLFQKEVKFLGHIVSEKGVATDPEKLRAISYWPSPSCAPEVRQFLGLWSYYRRFVVNFADIAYPLYQCTEGSSHFEWTEAAERAFNQLKWALMTAPVLGYPRPCDHFVLDTDASGTGIGAVMFQLQNGEEKVIAYYSHQLSKHEHHYCATSRELLAIV